MKKILFQSLLIIGIFHLSACRNNDENIDQEKPIIVSDYSESFPTSCSVVKRGESILFKAKFTDNVELGNYNIQVHHNFDHHNHDTSVASCANEDEIKKPIRPWVFNQDFKIPSGSKSTEVSQNIVIPNDIDTGDYHFMIKVTDKSGWATQKGISIKVVE